MIHVENCLYGFIGLTRKKGPHITDHFLGMAACFTVGKNARRKGWLNYVLKISRLS
jgi:hypothetical protein